MAYPQLSLAQITALLSEATIKRIAPGIKASILASLTGDGPRILHQRSINTICRIAHFFAQIKKETGGLKRLDENMNYTTAARIAAIWPSRFASVASAAPYVSNPEKLANFVYANRNGNGSVASGDGFAYRGSGLIQLTGRANFRTVGQLIGLGSELEDDPEKVRKPDSTVDIATGYWAARKINEVADGDGPDDVDNVTKRVNPYESAGGRKERRDNFADALAILIAAVPAVKETASGRGRTAARESSATVFSAPQLAMEFPTTPSASEIARDRQGGDDQALPKATREATAALPAVFWPQNDANSPDYAHLAAFDTNPADQGNFELQADDIELLIRANAFAVPAGQNIVTIALRGATLNTGHEKVAETVACLDARPDHRNFRCLIGFLDRPNRILSLFSASTVPCPYWMKNYYAQENGLPFSDGTKCNMMPSGSYVFRVAHHNTIRPALRMSDIDDLENDAPVCVWRTANDLTYGTADMLDPPARVFDNIHCAYLENYSARYEASFSSAGCLTVRGRQTPTAQWKKFQAMLNIIGNGKRTDLVLLTGKEAALASGLRRSGQAGDAAIVRQRLGRLRAGSTGDGVKVLQGKIGVGKSGYFGPVTAKAFHTWQMAQGMKADGIYSPEIEAATKWGAL